MKKLLLVGCLLIFSVVLSWGLVELLLHVSHYQKKSLLAAEDIDERTAFFRLDSELIYTGRYAHNNSLPVGDSKIPWVSLRPDRFPNYTATNDTFTIVTLGDSFTYGHNLFDEDTYPTYLEQILIDQGYNVNVFNAGVSGYGTDQEYVLAKRILSVYKPDLLIINVHENDLADSNDNCLFKVEPAGGYDQVSGIFSNTYLQTSALLRSPRWLKTSNTLNLVLATLNRNGRFNFACSSTTYDFEDQMLNKITYLLTKLKQELPAETKLMVTMVPLQDYFNASTSTEQVTLLRRTRLLTALKDLAVVDANKEIAFSTSPDIYTLREGIDLRVAGVSTESSPVPATFAAEILADPSHQLFLNDNQEPESPFGSKHPNKLGAFLFAKTVADEIKTRYFATDIH